MVGVESTVLNVATDIPTVLRPGGISLEDLRTVVPQVQPPHIASATRQENAALLSPGQMLVHYSPSIPTYLVDGTPAEIRTLMLEEITHAHQRGERIGLLVADEDLPTFRECDAEIYALGSSLEEIATHLYAGLRTLEETQVTALFCRNFTDQGLGLAIRDRLLKAAGGKIIKRA
jgi:L-threonylcarbamoyladenylate synthase